MRWPWFLIISILHCSVGTQVNCAWAANEETPVARYFDQLRQRRFFSLAESYAEARLSDPHLPAPLRIEFAIELSRTLTVHALVVSDDQQEELWQRAVEVLRDEQRVSRDAPRRILLDVYLELISAARVEQLVFDIEASPFEDPPRETLLKLIGESLPRISDSETMLAETIHQQEGKKTPPGGLSLEELRRLHSHLWERTGEILLAKARMSPAGSPDRHSDVLDADEFFRKVLSRGSENWHAEAKLGLVIGNRLRDDFDRALSMLDQLEKEQKPIGGPLYDRVRIERARTLLLIQQPDVAAEALLAMRAGRKRLPGEFWQVHLQVLAALRRLAVKGNGKSLVGELDEQAHQAINEVDEQVGGVWSRRCRSIWSSVESADRYGPRLATLLKKAEGDYLAGHLESAVTTYASAVDLAHEEKQTDVEMNAGATLLAVLAKVGRWDEVVHRAAELVREHAEHSKAPEIDLLGVYAQGQLYDRHSNPDQHAVYRHAIEEHLRRFPKSPTVSEADYLLGRLQETSGQFAEAITSYERVSSDHVRRAAASASLLRCWVARLIQQKATGEPDARLFLQATEAARLQKSALPTDPKDWSAANWELAYHGIKVLLLVEPAHFLEADDWLNRLKQSLEVSGQDTENVAGEAKLRDELRRRLGPLQLITLAGQGKAREAEQLLGSLQRIGPSELLTVVEELSEMEIPQPVSAHLTLVEIQLSSAEALNHRRNELSKEQQQRLDFTLAKSYFATSQPTKAVEVFQKLLEGAPRDASLARRIGQTLSAREELFCRTLALASWQRVEQSCKQGSAEWLEARYHVIEAHVRLREFDQARKLLAVTKLLYPQLGGEELKQRFLALESRFQ